MNAMPAVIVAMAMPFVVIRWAPSSVCASEAMSRRTGNVFVSKTAHSAETHSTPEHLVENMQLFCWLQNCFMVAFFHPTFSTFLWKSIAISFLVTL